MAYQINSKGFKIEYSPLVELSTLSKDSRLKILKGLYTLREPNKEPLFKLEVDIYKWHGDNRQTCVDVILVDRKGIPDCNISHFGYNFYYRTKVGMQERAYTSLGRLIASVKKKVREHEGTVYNVRLRCGNNSIILD